MAISLTVHRAAIGISNNKKINRARFSISIVLITTFGLNIYILISNYLMVRLIMAGDVELNPGPIMTCLNIGHINARSLVNEEKFEEISSFIFQKNFELFAITETWLNNQISNDDLCIPGFHAIVRKDRPNTRGGGVALYITQSLAFKRRNDLENNNLELLWVEVKVHKQTLLCGVCYRAPNNSLQDVSIFLDSLQSIIDKIRQNPHTFIMIIGNLNAHYDCNNLSSTGFGNHFNHWLQCNALYQIIREPTRLTETTSTILDVVITNYPRYFFDSGTCM